MTKKAFLVWMLVLGNFAYGVPGDVGTAWTVPVIQRMELSIDNFEFPPTTPAHLEQGYIEAEQALLISVSSNTGWKVTVKTTDDDMGTLGGRLKPISDLLWKRHRVGPYRPITHDDQLVMARTTPVAQRRMFLDYRVLLDWVEDSPGAYEISLLFTVGTHL